MPVEATFKARDSQPWDPARVEVDVGVISVDTVEQADCGVCSVGRIKTGAEVTA